MRNMAKIAAICNQKSGVGKTVTAVNLGIELAREGKHDLLVDVDAQANLIKMLDQRKPHDHPEIVRRHEGFDFVPGNRSLSAMKVSLE